MTPKVRASVIGAGWYAAQNHIPTLAARGDVLLDGVSRLGTEELARVKDHFGFVFASEDYGAVLARKPDVVVVASPHHLHFEHARAAIESGAHVLCEKPMTLVPEEAWELTRLARHHGRHLLIANGYNYLPHVNVLANRVAAGAIGNIEHAAVSFISATRDVFEGDRGLRQWETAMFRPDRGTWQDPAQGGGFAYGQLSHALALLLYVSGLAPETIAGHVLAHNGIDLANSASLLLSNGAVAGISGAAAMPQGNRALMRLSLAGDAGLLTADFDTDRAEIRRHDGLIETMPLRTGDWIYNCVGPVNALVELAQGRGDNRSSGTAGAQAVGIIAGLLQSARAGGAPQPVRGAP
ncbi:hypothetical protein DMC47_13315 [Nostoc sp. 3335mG]|nr:hypothetical protein DMC47_13315 [Nostoc sp. 3335mG]